MSSALIRVRELAAIGVRAQLQVLAQLCVFAQLCVLVCLAGLSGGALAQSEGRIDIQFARIQAERASWLLDAEAIIELTPAMQAGLDSGVPLTFIVEFELNELRNFWADAPILGFTRSYRLIYYELTRHYRVQALNGGVSRNYRSLLSALEGLGRLESLRIGRPTLMQLGDRPPDVERQPVALGRNTPSARTDPSQALAGDAASLLARLSIRFDSKALPLPLQPLFGSTWRLAEATHEWAVP